LRWREKLRRTYASHFTTIARIYSGGRWTGWPADAGVFDLDARGRDSKSTVAGQPTDSLGFSHPSCAVSWVHCLLLRGPVEVTKAGTRAFGFGLIDAMNENAETKICPFCAETIKVAARKCPCCNSRLGRWELFGYDLWTGVGYLIIFGGFIFALVKLAPEDSPEGGRNFARHRDELTISKVEVEVVPRGTSAFDYSVSGLVTNKGGYPWKIQEFELTVSNAVGATDVKNQRIEEPFVVQPHSENAFAFRSYTTVTNTIVSARARVADAQDGSRSSSD